MSVDLCTHRCLLGCQYFLYILRVHWRSLEDSHIVCIRCYGVLGITPPYLDYAEVFIQRLQQGVNTQGEQQLFERAPLPYGATYWDKASTKFIYLYLR